MQEICFLDVFCACFLRSSFVDLRLNVQEYNKNEHINTNHKFALQVEKSLTGCKRDHSELKIAPVVMSLIYISGDLKRELKSEKRSFLSY